jgi:hypothetical protein
MEECLICKDTGSEPIIDNTKCTCKYKYHNTCWNRYVKSKTPVLCLLCRAPLSTYEMSSLPQIPYRYNNTHRTLEQQITYQEFVERVNIYYRQPQPQPQPSAPVVNPEPLTPQQIEYHNYINNKYNKIFKIIICAGIVLAIVIAIVLFA